MNKSFSTLSIIAGTFGQFLCGQASAEFLKDSKAALTLRNFYINQDPRTIDRPRVEQWGQGFILDYKSGYTEGPVGFGLNLLGTYAIRLDDGGRTGKSDLKRMPGETFPQSNGKSVNEFGRLGVTAKMRYSATELQAGTILPKVPVVTYNDGRLLPQTFEGVQITSKEVDNVLITAGRLERSTERNSSNSDSLSIMGSNNRQTGKFSNQFYYTAIEYKPVKNLQLQYNFGKLQDFYKQNFFGLIHDLQFPVGSLKTDLRYFHNEATGKNASRSGRAEGYRSNGHWNTGDPDRYKVDNKLWSAQFIYSLSGHSLKAGYQKVTGKSDFPSIAPDGGTGRPTYVITRSNTQAAQFFSAGEKTWLVGYGYDFAKLGLPGLKFDTTYYKGSNIKDVGNDAREWARDINLSYQVQNGMLKGLGVVWRNGIWRGNDSSAFAVDRDENRVIVNYTLNLL
ncbi:OprD family outer membrane porin [Azomonas macrocytogenes]|nr:OprD family outer membrane porin [Azomonas macrocytogenes]